MFGGPEGFGLRNGRFCHHAPATLSICATISQNPRHRNRNGSGRVLWQSAGKCKRMCRAHRWQGQVMEGSVNFTRMDQGTYEEYQLLEDKFKVCYDQLPDSV